MLESIFTRNSAGSFRNKKMEMKKMNTVEIVVYVIVYVFVISIAIQSYRLKKRRDEKKKR